MIKVYCDINGTYEGFDSGREKLVVKFVSLLEKIAINNNEGISFSFCSSYPDVEITEYIKELTPYLNKTHILMDKSITKTYDGTTVTSKFKNMLINIKENINNYSMIFYLDDDHDLITAFLSYMNKEYTFIKCIGINPTYYEDSENLYTSLLFELYGVNEALTKYLNDNK